MEVANLMGIAFAVTFLIFFSLKAKGYKLSEISWMTSINIDIHDERGGANG